MTSLADSGPGSLREALNQSGPRIILFKTGGVIELKSTLGVRKSHVTIAAQTAPGDGIILRGYPMRIAASDVIVRGLRIRNGDQKGPRGDLRDGLQIGNQDEQIHDVIIDHCSFGWSVNEIVDFWYGSRNVTLSHNIFSEALWKSIHEKGSNGYGMLIGNKPNERITLCQNLFAHNERRNPWIKDDASVELINNVIYNWSTEATGAWLGEDAKPIFVNIIGNYYKGGAATASRIKAGKRFIDLHLPTPVGSRLHIHDNFGACRTDDAQDDWDAVQLGAFDPAPFRSNEPLKEAASGIQALRPAEAFESVLKHAGAVPRDKADTRAIDDTRNGTGKHINSLEQIGGYPAYAPGTPPQDSDDDGIPDDWETSHGLDPKNKADATKFSARGSGYLNIEGYINSLIPTTIK